MLFVDFKKLFLTVFATAWASFGASPLAINLEVIVLSASGC